VELQAVFIYLSSWYRDFPTVDSQFYVPDDPPNPVINLRGNSLPFAPAYTGALVTNIRSGSLTERGSCRVYKQSIRPKCF
jgi:hypothetical protein